MDRAAAVNAVSRLSEKHLQVLARVAEHRVAKEIAWELGIAEDTVAQRMKRVQTLLGVASRAEAARMYLEALQTGGVSVPVVYETGGLADRKGPGDKDASPGTGAGTGGGTETLHQSPPAYTTDVIDWPAPKSWTAWLLETGRQNDLSPTARTLAIVAMALLAILSVAAAVALAEGLSRVF
jgi:DNA-binding CsgD family transcriptional regulator